MQIAKKVNMRLKLKQVQNMYFTTNTDLSSTALDYIEQSKIKTHSKKYTDI
jgi:hypothetical protein